MFRNPPIRQSALRCPSTLERHRQGPRKFTLYRGLRRENIATRRKRACLRGLEVLAMTQAAPRAGTRRQLPLFLERPARGTRGETQSTRPRAQTGPQDLFLSPFFCLVQLSVDGEKSLVERAGTSRSIGVEITGGLKAVVCWWLRERGRRERERASESRGWWQVVLVVVVALCIFSRASWPNSLWRFWCND